jgi:hypothetical protein
MESELRLPPKTIANGSFKYSPDGWLFTIRDPWLFFKRRTYRVTDTQKPTIVARLRRGRTIRLFVVVLLLILLAWLLSDNPAVGQAHLLEAALSIAALTIVLVSLLNAIEYLAVRSLLRDLPFDPRRISLAETFLVDIILYARHGVRHIPSSYFRTCTAPRRDIHDSNRPGCNLED